MSFRLVFFAIILFVATGCKRAVSYDRTVNKSLHNKKVGESARDLLTAQHYTALNIEVQYMPGYLPDPKALASIKDFLDVLIHKPNGIAIRTKEIATTQDTVLTKEQVMALESANRRSFTDGATLSLYILITNGYPVDKKMLGYAYRNTSVVLFGRNIQASSDTWGRLTRSELETRVLQHEMGHLLGLTNLGSPMTDKHADHKSGIHCSNKQCLMYAKMETTDYPAFLLKKDRPALDANCIKDLQANGGKMNGLYYVSLKNILGQK